MRRVGWRAHDRRSQKSRATHDVGIRRQDCAQEVCPPERRPERSPDRRCHKRTSMEADNGQRRPRSVPERSTRARSAYWQGITRRAEIEPYACAALPFIARGLERDPSKIFRRIYETVE